MSDDQCDLYKLNFLILIILAFTKNVKIHPVVPECTVFEL